MDEVDRAIVKHLQQDARQTNRELARKLGIAPSTCLERVRALRERGVITGYHAEISLAALNRHVQALLHVQIRPLSRAVIQDFKAFVAAQPEVISVFVVSGGDDLIVHVAVPSVDGLHAFLMDRLSKRREIVGFRSSVIFQHAHNQVIDPLDSPLKHDRPARGAGSGDGAGGLGAPGAEVEHVGHQRGRPGR